MFRQGLALLRSSASGAGSLLRSSVSGGAGLRSVGGAGPMPRSVASGSGGGPLLLPRSMASGVSASCGGACPGHKALLATLSIVTSFSAMTIFLDKEGASASSEPEKEDDVLPELEEDALPEFVDWELQGAVNIPRDQGNCGSCWAHTAVGAIEGVHQIVWGELLNLSVQSVIDCARRMDKRGRIVTGWGCGGGRAVDAFVHVMRFGLTTDEAYPLRSILGHGFCKSAGKEVNVVINDWGMSYPDERSLMAAVAKQPVVVAVDRFHDAFDFKGGFIEIEQWPPAKEPKDQHTHGVLVVGYGTDLLGRKYWKIKNSYGETWGDKGFAYLRRGGPDPRGVGGITRYRGIYPVIYDMN